MIWAESQLVAFIAVVWKYNVGCDQIILAEAAAIKNCERLVLLWTCEGSPEAERRWVSRELVIC